MTELIIFFQGHRPPVNGSVNGTDYTWGWGGCWGCGGWGWGGWGGGWGGWGWGK